MCSEFILPDFFSHRLHLSAFLNYITIKYHISKVPKWQEKWLNNLYTWIEIIILTFIIFYFNQILQYFKISMISDGNILRLLYFLIFILSSLSSIPCPSFNHTSAKFEIKNKWIFWMILQLGLFKGVMKGKLISVVYTLRTHWNQFSLGGICKQE